MSKFQIQNKLYNFPYHYIPYFDCDVPVSNRTLHWGWEYLTYMSYIITLIKNELSETKSILDIGCGDGFFLNNIDIPAKKVGIDLSHKAIQFAQAFSSDVLFYIKDIHSVDEKFDLITLIEVLEHIPDDEVDSFITKTINCIKENGYFLVCVPTDVRPVTAKHYRHYNPELLNKHVGRNNLSVIKQVTLFNETKRLKSILKLLNNKYFTINSKKIIGYFWKMHLKKSFFAMDNGTHLITLFRKENNAAYTKS